MKYLVILVVLVLVYAWLRGQRNAGAQPPPERPPLPTPQDTVACAHCGVHIPRSEALTLGMRSYCCAEHQREDGA